MVSDHFLGAYCELNQLARPELLGGRLVTDLQSHICDPTLDRPRANPRVAQITEFLVSRPSSRPIRRAAAPERPRACPANGPDTGLVMSGTWVSATRRASSLRILIGPIISAVSRYVR
jgi:hypothetical protein